ncbi:mitogen-activated protein kinase kinase kinase 19 [Pelodytes ibericus]
MDEELLSVFLEAAAQGDVERIIHSFTALSVRPQLINHQHPESGNTALILAAGGNFPEVVGFLLEQGADVTLSNVSNQTALHVASDDIQRQLLSAGTTTSCPEQNLAQAAWQGDLEIVQHLLCTEPSLDVDQQNQQGLTPLMLAVRDGDLFDKLDIDYRPLDVLLELLKHDANPGLCDSKGKPALCYASDVKPPLRQQLIDALSRPATDAENEVFCGFYTDTKNPLFAAPTTSRDQTGLADQRSWPRAELKTDGIYNNKIEKQDPFIPESNAGSHEADCRILKDFREGYHLLQDMEKTYKKYEIERTSLPRLWLSEPLPNAILSKLSNNRHVLPTPGHASRDDGTEKMKSLGLGYLLQASRSEPAFSKILRTNPLTDIVDIKQNIWKRLGTPESTQNREHAPSLCHSPRSVRLPPLEKTRATETEDTISKQINGEKEDVLLCRKSSQEHNLEDTIVSKDFIYLSMGEGLIASGSFEHDEEETLVTKRISNRSPSMENINTLEASSEHDDDKAGERVQKMSKDEDVIHERLVLDKQDGDWWRLALTDKQSTKDTVEVCEPEPNAHPGGLTASVGLDSSRLARSGLVPLVHITFSEQEPPRELRSSSAKEFQKTRKTNVCGVPHNVNHSFNIIAQRENEKVKKHKKVRNQSASDAPLRNQQRPLSNCKKNSLKSLPVTSLGSPTSSKLSKKAKKIDHSSLEKAIKPCHVDISRKRLSSPTKVPKPITRAKTAPDFLHYQDMFVELKPQKEGPSIYEMFGTPFYATGKESCNDASHPHRTSGSSNKTLAPKSVRSVSANDNKTRVPKRPNSRNKKNSSGSSQKRNGSSAKHKAMTDMQGVKDNEVIISGLDWHIKAKQQDVLNIISDLGLKSPETIEHGQLNIFHSDLSIIKEATLERSISMNGHSSLNFTKMILELEKMSDKEINQHEYLEPMYKGKLPEDESHQRAIFQPKISPTNQDEEQNVQPLRDVHISVQGLSHSREKLDEFRSSSHGERLEENFTENHMTNIFTETAQRESLISGSEREGSNPVLSMHEFGEDICTTNPESDQTDELICYLEKKLLSLDEKDISLSKTLTNVEPDQENLDSNKQREDVRPEQPVPDMKEGYKNASLNTNNNSNNMNLTEDGEFNLNTDGSIPWIKGEVLGKGAYGTVYCGLTSQGELIAAKQVVLDASDPGTAEKEYKKLQEEVDLLKTLKHVNIVGYLGTDLQDNMVTIFMEFVPGGSISSILKRFGPLYEIVIRRYTKHILHGIAYLHKNRVIHRDIKGNNVMLMPNGILKLIDFGCAKRLTRLSMSGTRSEVLKSMHGTPYWMAPEVITESGHGEKSDIWSIGCTVYEMATGKPPLAHMHKMAAMYYIGAHKGIMPTLPDHFSKKARDFTNLCLIRDQDERPSAEQLLRHQFINRRL